MDQEAPASPSASCTAVPMELKARVEVEEAKHGHEALDKTGTLPSEDGQRAHGLGEDVEAKRIETAKKGENDKKKDDKNKTHKKHEKKKREKKAKKKEKKRKKKEKKKDKEKNDKTQTEKAKKSKSTKQDKKSQSQSKEEEEDANNASIEDAEAALAIKNANTSNKEKKHPSCSRIKENAAGPCRNPEAAAPERSSLPI